MSLSNKYGEISIQNRENDLQVAERLGELLVLLNGQPATLIVAGVRSELEAALTKVVRVVNEREGPDGLRTT